MAKLCGLPLALGCAGAEALSQAKDEFYMKILRADRAAGEIEAELETPAKHTKITFAGDVGDVFDGEYVKFKVRNKRWTIAGKEMAVKTVTWIF